MLPRQKPNADGCSRPKVMLDFRRSDWPGIACCLFSSRLRGAPLARECLADADTPPSKRESFLEECQGRRARDATVQESVRNTRAHADRVSAPARRSLLCEP